MTSKPRKRRRTRKKKRSSYTVGEINKLIDVLIHPLAEKDKSFILLDGVLHAFNERDPPQSLLKFIKYNLP
jgi:hypothetical protein